MCNITEKAKNYWEEHKFDIITIGTGAAVVIGAGLAMYKAYNAGFIDGAMTGFDISLDWLDKTFPEEEIVFTNKVLEEARNEYVLKVTGKYENFGFLEKNTCKLK